MALFPSSGVITAADAALECAVVAVVVAFVCDAGVFSSRVTNGVGSDKKKQLKEQTQDGEADRNKMT